MGMISLHNITKKYQQGSVKTEVLKGVNLEVAKGEFVAIMGRSGCGKSTLLNIIGGMDRADGGSYLFNEKEIPCMSAKKMAHFRNKNVGFVFQAFHLMAEFNVLDNIALPLGYAGISGKMRKEKAKELLSKIGLTDKAKSRPFQLSGGEQQRIAIARAISNEPEVLLADEPTGSLDEENGTHVMELLKSLGKQGLTIIMVTHDKKVAEYADRIVTMKNGRIE